jgi:hypothetical protein
VRCRGCSLSLQRLLTDFGADHSFAQASAKVKEYYLIEVPASAARLYTHKHAAKRAGAGQQSRIHCVGDGAGWIARQVEEGFGDQGRYLIDFYQVSEYLAEACESISREPQGWRRKQQERLKSNPVGKVLAELTAHLEERDEELAPVRACWRYLSNRLENLDYQGAIEAGLPIGSGEIESGNRSMIQARLKRSGAWWKEDNAEVMLALRTLRASGEWETYWHNLLNLLEPARGLEPLTSVYEAQATQLLRTARNIEGRIL